MARQRMIKPEFFFSESLAQCSVAARLAFIGLWVEADDYGHLKAQSKRLRKCIFPYDGMSDARFVKLLGELEEVGCIQSYEIDGEKYIEIPNFSVYQKVNRPSKSNIPEPSKKQTHGTLNEHSRSTHAKERKKETSTNVDVKERNKERGRFTPPSVDEVREYITEKGYTFDAEAFCAFYESKGWLVGKEPMKSWKSACTTWQCREAKRKGGEISAKYQQYAGSW